MQSEKRKMRNQLSAPKFEISNVRFQISNLKLQSFCFLLSAFCFAVIPGLAAAVDHVTLKNQGQQTQVDGRVLVTAQDGGLLLQGRDGVLWTVEPQEIVAHTSDDAEFTPMPADALGARVLAELPKGFEVLNTAHYVICFNTRREYAQWCGSLFEKLYGAFTNYWTQRRFKLSEPDFPLVAVVFADRKSYQSFSQAELGASAESIIGYFSLRSNRMTMFDLTGVESGGHSRLRHGTAAEINQILSQPDAERTVATIVHEATHQIAFNCGLHTRYSDCPLWFSEGIAVYFETPDLSSSKGWRGVGGINRSRLTQFRQYMNHRRHDSLETLIGNDKRFRDPNTSLDAYAEAWALTYFLLLKHQDQYIKYLKVLAEKKPLIWDSEEKRLEQFTAAFGDLRKLDAELVRYMARVQ